MDLLFIRYEYENYDSEDKTIKDHIYFYFTEIDEDGHGTLFVNGKKIDTDVYDVEGYYNGKLYYSTDYDDGEYSLKVSNCKKQGKLIADDVSNVQYINQQVYFITDFDDEDENGTLNIVNGNKFKVVSEDVYQIYEPMLVDEDKMIFIKDYDKEDREGTLVMLKGKKQIELDSNISGFAWIDIR